jgi:hypothetical protein
MGMASSFSGDEVTASTFSTRSAGHSARSDDSNF